MTGRAALAAVALSAAVAGAATLPSLSDADARRVDRGGTVVHQRPVEGFPWPEVVVTGDRGLLVLESYRRVKIVRPAYASYS
jgi:hypothetical protein